MSSIDAGYIVIPMSEVHARKKAAERWRQIQIDRSAPPFGSFAWVCIPPDGSIITGLSPAQATKLAFLATTMDYSGRILPEYHTLSVSAIANAIGSYQKDARRLLTAAQAHGYLFFDGAVFYMSPTLFSRGSITEQPAGHNYIRMYFSTVKALYESADGGSRDVLYYLILLLPFVNLKCNILCENPTEY